MIVSQLASGLGGFLTWRRYTITFQDLQATSGSGAQLINLVGPNLNDVQGFVPAGGIVLGVRVKQSVSFSGGGLSAMTVSLGKSGSVTFFTATQDIFQAVGDTVLQETALFKKGQITPLQMTANFTPTGANCSAATAGSVDIDVLMLNLTTDLTTIP